MGKVRNAPTPPEETLTGGQLDKVVRNKPTKQEVAVAGATDAVTRFPARPIVAFKDRKVDFGSAEAFLATLPMLMQTFATASPEEAFRQMNELAGIVCHPKLEFGERPEELNSALAMVAAIAPRNELEAALAVQMAGTHTLAMQLLGAARGSTNPDGTEFAAKLSVKLQRLFLSQYEALARSRDKGRQIVEVNHVQTRARGTGTRRGSDGGGGVAS